MSDALKARRGLQPTDPWGKRPPLNDFALGPLMAALDLIEFDGIDTDEAVRRALVGDRGRRNHEGLGAWTEHAVAGYLATRPADGWRPDREKWTFTSTLSKPDARGVRSYEINAWGRRYRHADGAAELRLIGFRGRRREPGELAVAGLVVASASGPPQRVRISDFSCLAGTVEVLCDRTREEALDFYRSHGRDALGDAVDGVERRPGDACVACRHRSACRDRVLAPGVLGIADRNGPRRTWSVTDGRRYRQCPAREHLRRLRLPPADAVERAPAVERGRAVHAHLEARHRAGLRCGPEVPEDWPDRELPGQQVAVGAEMLRQHAELCPLSLAPTEVRVEPKVAVEDPAAEVVVVVTPDLWYREGGSLVWREVKTTTSANPAGLFQGLAAIPQLALAVVLIARGALGDVGPAPRVELEVLHPDGGDLRFFDPLDLAVVAEAEEVVTALAAPWHADTESAPRPGPACHDCEVLRWCPSGRAEVAR